MRGEEARTTKNETNITNFVDIPPVDSLNIYKVTRVHMTRFGIQIFWQKDSKRGQYGGILRE